jgi:hypothetical protein
VACLIPFINYDCSVKSLSNYCYTKLLINKSNIARQYSNSLKSFLIGEHSWTHCSILTIKFVLATDLILCVAVLAQFRMEQDPIKKEEKKARLMKETIPFYLSKFEKILSENNGFSVGNEVSDNFEIPPFSSLFCRLLRVCARTTATAHLPNKGND